MPISFTCESCRQTVSVSRKYAGRKGLCPRCKSPTRVPGEPQKGVSGALPAVMTSSAEDQPLVHTLAGAGDEDRLEHDRIQLELERAKLAMERAQLERERERTQVERIREATEHEIVEDESREEVECPACAELVKARAKVCKHCGNDLTQPHRRGKSGRARRPSERVTVVHHHHGSTKSPGLAAVLAFFFPGVGHIY